MSEPDSRICFDTSTLTQDHKHWRSYRDRLSTCFTCSADWRTLRCIEVAPCNYCNEALTEFQLNYSRVTVLLFQCFKHSMQSLKWRLFS